MNYSDIKDNVQITHHESDTWVVKVIGKIKYFREFLIYCKVNGARYSKEKDGLVFKSDPMDVLINYEFVYKSKSKGGKVGRLKGSL